MKEKISKKNTTPIYLKVEAEEMVENKKILLSFEASALKISQSISNYKILRMDELEKKDLVVKKALNLKKEYLKLISLLPTFSLPKIVSNNSSYESIPETKSIRLVT